MVEVNGVKPATLEALRDQYINLFHQLVPLVLARDIDEVQRIRTQAAVTFEQMVDSASAEFKAIFPKERSSYLAFLSSSLGSKKGNQLSGFMPAEVAKLSNRLMARANEKIEGPEFSR